MATSSSDESVAPKDFHLSSSLDSGSRLSVNHHKCQLCRGFRKLFYCKRCIRNGDFTHSSACLETSERFAEKQLRLLHLKSSKRIVEDRCHELLQRNIKINEMKSEINNCHERIEWLQSLLKERKNKLSKNKTKLTELVKHNQENTHRQRQYENHCTRTEDFITYKHREMGRKKEKLYSFHAIIRTVTKQRVDELLQYIFPITEANSVIRRLPMETDASEGALNIAVAETKQTAYVQCRYVVTESRLELRHQIVGPSLPAHSNNSIIKEWVSSLSQLKKSHEGNGNDVTINTCAALHFATQLINVLAYYLDVRLPHKVVYSDFCTDYMNETPLVRRLARLNGNILHLCFTQNVPPIVLQPDTPLLNLKCLLDTTISDLGRRGPVEVDPYEAFAVESQLSRDLAVRSEDDSSSSDEDMLPWEWDSMQDVQDTDMDVLVPCLEQKSSAGNQTALAAAQQSITGNLITSAAAGIASLWRLTTGK